MGSCCHIPPSTTPEHPHLIGEPDGTLVRARVTLHAYRMAAGTVGWFTGTGVPVVVAKGVLVPL